MGGSDEDLELQKVVTGSGIDNSVFTILLFETILGGRRRCDLLVMSLGMDGCCRWGGDNGRGPTTPGRGHHQQDAAKIYRQVYCMYTAYGEPDLRPDTGY